MGTKDKKRKGIRIQTVSRVCAFIAIILLLFVGYNLHRVIGNYKNLVQKFDLHLQSHEYISKLQNGSDDMTEESRLFVVTKDPECMMKYSAIVDNEVREKAKKNCEDYFAKMGYSQSVGDLDKALKESDALMDRELHAMKLMVQILNLDDASIPKQIKQYQLPDGEINWSNDKKQELATELVFGTEYRKEKDQINSDIETALTQISQKLESDTKIGIENMWNVIVHAVISCVLLAILFAVIFVLITVLVLRPLQHYVKAVKQNHRFDIMGAYEIRYLAKTYNSIYEIDQENKARMNFELEHDTLTNAYSRRAFDEYKQSLMQKGTPIALLIIDVDHFKNINDLYGHDVGDKALERIAYTLHHLLRNDDIVARIGGDEFGVILMNIQENNQAIIGRKIDKINYILQNPEDGFPKMSISVGVAFSENGYSEELFKCADRKLYEAKALGRCGYSIYDSHSTSEKQMISKERAVDTDAVFGRIFSMKVQDMLSTDELTKTMTAMNNTYRANFFIRLADYSYVVLKDLVINRENRAFSYKDAQKMLFENIKKKVLPDFHDNFFKFADLSTLAERMKNKDSIKYEYQNIQKVWCVATFSAIEREQGNVTKVIYLVSELTHDRAEAHELLKMQKEAVSLLSNSELLFISVIERETGASRLIQSRRFIDTSRIYDFNDSMKREASHLLASEQEGFLKNMQLEKIQEELRNHHQYTVTTFLQLPDSGRYRRVSYHFAAFDKFPDYILSATEDSTESYILDTITGKKNYEGFKMDCMYHFAHPAPNRYVVLNFNIANFKAINTMYGYEAGNWLLKEIIDNLSASSIPFLSVCRENADNFFCLCQKEDYDFERLNSLCKMKISNANGLTESMELFCGIYPISDNNETIDAACDKARIAKRYAEREIGVNAYVLDEKEKARYLDEAAILASITDAIHKKELVVFYQPIFDAKSGVMTSAEALVRWMHPERGLIPPGLFIPAVERTGQIAEIDLYVGHNVLQFQKERFALGKARVPISINVSRYDFLQEKYMKTALSNMQHNSEIANMIRIEITESGLINIPSCGERFMNEMRSLGIQTMIDDFGTGYSSLASIVDRPCDIIKLDMSFARKIGVEKEIEILIVASIETAHRLGVKVVAEGVETKEQYEFLKENECDYIQGYYFSKPLPENEFEQLLEALDESVD